MPVESVTKLDVLGNQCIHLFTAIYGLLDSESQEHHGAISKEDVQNELGRFRIWAENIGALQSRNKTTSLEYRLREASETRLHIQQFLEDIKESLTEVTSIISGDREEWQENEPGVVDDSILESFCSTEQPISEVRELMAAVANCTTFLFQLSMVIRKATPRDRYTKAASVGTFSPDFDIDYVRNKFPSANEWLIERLGKANARRREYFKYCRLHHQSLSSLSDPGPGPAISETRLTQRHGAARSEGNFNSVPSTTASTYLPQMVPAMINHAEEASVKSYARSIVDPESGGLSLPPRPKESEDGSPFECPYCYMIQEADSDHVWRNHVMRDLQPYVCTYKDCSFKLFSSRQEWFEHELANHRRIWRCEKCFKSCSSVGVFSRHLDSCYSANLSSRSKSNLISRSERSVSGIPAVECPLCDTWNSSLQKANNTDEDVVVTTEKFQRHLGQHLEKLALFALPRLQLEDDDENVGSHDALGKDKGHDSQQLNIDRLEVGSQYFSDLGTPPSIVARSANSDRAISNPDGEKSARKEAPPDNGEGKPGNVGERGGLDELAEVAMILQTLERGGQIPGKPSTGITVDRSADPRKRSNMYNMYGRKGTLKCDSCRARKRPCTHV